MSYAQQGYSAGAVNTLYGTDAPKAVPAPTLLGISSNVDELLKRLSDLASGATDLAQKIGGPFPVGGENAAEPPASGMIESLDRRVHAANRLIGDIAHAIDAMRRSLGA